MNNKKVVLGGLLVIGIAIGAFLVKLVSAPTVDVASITAQVVAEGKKQLGSSGNTFASKIQALDGIGGKGGSTGAAHFYSSRVSAEYQSCVVGPIEATSTVLGWSLQVLRNATTSVKVVGLATTTTANATTTSGTVPIDFWGHTLQGSFSAYLTPPTVSSTSPESGTDKRMLRPGEYAFFSIKGGAGSSTPTELDGMCNLVTSAVN